MELTCYIYDGQDPKIRPAGWKRDWTTSRNVFQDKIRETKPGKPSDKWQKLYYRGVALDRSPGPDEHQAKLRVRPFGRES